MESLRILTPTKKIMMGHKYKTFSFKCSWLKGGTCLRSIFKRKLQNLISVGIDFETLIFGKVIKMS